MPNTPRLNLLLTYTRLHDESLEAAAKVITVSVKLNYKRQKRGATLPIFKDPRFSTIFSRANVVQLLVY
jgi:type III secretory pathway component EscS